MCVPVLCVHVLYRGMRWRTGRFFVLELQKRGILCLVARVRVVHARKMCKDVRVSYRFIGRIDGAIVAATGRSDRRGDCRGDRQLVARLNTCSSRRRSLRLSRRPITLHVRSICVPLQLKANSDGCLQCLLCYIDRSLIKVYENYTLGPHSCKL